MKIAEATILITGANRGIGLAFAKAFMARGARKVYAAARNPLNVTMPGVEPLKLDVTSIADIEHAAGLAGDVSIVVNNAGIAMVGGFLAENSEILLRNHFETNVFGALNVSRAFAPVLARNGGGALVNVASVGSWVTFPMLATYATSKAALWSISNGLRHELREQGTQVMSLHMGFVDTDLTKGIDAEKSTPEAIVEYALDRLEAGAEEALADEITRHVHQNLSSEPPVYLIPR